LRRGAPANAIVNFSFHLTLLTSLTCSLFGRIRNPCLDQAGVGTSHDTLVDRAVAEILEEAMETLPVQVSVKGPGLL
jgi:hypothetical protein